MKIKLLNKSTHELSEICAVYCKIRSLLREFYNLEYELKDGNNDREKNATAQKRYAVLDAIINSLYENTKPTTDALIEMQKLGLVDNQGELLAIVKDFIKTQTNPRKMVTTPFATDFSQINLRECGVTLRELIYAMKQEQDSIYRPSQPFNAEIPNNFVKEMDNHNSLNYVDYRGRIGLDHYDTIKMNVIYVVSTQDLIFQEKENIGNILLAIGRMQIAKEQCQHRATNSLTK